MSGSVGGRLLCLGVLGAVACSFGQKSPQELSAGGCFLVHFSNESGTGICSSLRSAALAVPWEVVIQHYAIVQGAVAVAAIRGGRMPGGGHGGDLPEHDGGGDT